MNVLTWFIQRWQLETTFDEARARKPRQWNDQSVSRTAPALFGLYPIITLAAAHLLGDSLLPFARSPDIRNTRRPSPMLLC
jgi:hypothetical protein